MTGLDWLRAGATLCVVLLHAGMPYTLAPWPGMVWVTRDPHPSPLVDALLWGIDVWVMPLFFLMSGFLAASLLVRLGPRPFLRHRLIRIGGPLLFGMLVILPLDLYAWLLAWVNQGWIEPVKLRSLKVNPPLGNDLWGLCHLWYLEYLLLFCLAAAGWHWRQTRSHNGTGTDPGQQQRTRASHHQTTISRSTAFTGAPRPADTLPLRPSVLADASSRQINSPLQPPPSSAIWRTPLLLLVATAMLWLQPRILLGFRHGFLPLPENMLFYAAWFVLGWQWFARGVDTASRTRGWGRIAGATALFVVLLPMIRHHIAHEAIPAADVTLPIAFVATSWLAATGLFEVALTIRRSPPRSVAYVAEASFWIYLVHHPIVALAQGNLALTAWPAAMKFGLVAVTGAALPLLSYQIAVQKTWIGAMLNRRRPADDTQQPSAVILESRRRAA